MSREPGEVLSRMAFRVELACDLGAVRPAVQRVCDFLRLHGYSAEEISACELALVEACNNAIDHTDTAGRDVPVGIEAISSLEQLELRVDDHTPGFDWPSSFALPPDESESGRGLYLIHSMMTAADYRRGRFGNSLILRRDRGLPREESPPPTVRLAQLERRLEESDRIIRDMADELSSCYESLSAIFRYSGEASRAGRVEEFSQQLLSDLLRVTGNAWYVFRLLQSGGAELVVSACSDSGLVWGPLQVDESTTEPMPFELEAAVKRRDVWFEDGSQLGMADPLGQIGKGSAGLVHPLYLDDTLVGTLAVGGPPAGRRFTAAQTNVTQAFADFLAIQVVNARFDEERMQALLAAQELQIAKQIQRSLLPSRLPEAPGLLLAGTCESASEVGGDFFDVISLGEGGFLLVVSDAMGKGLPAAVFAMILRSLLRALQDQGPRPGTLLRRANRLLYDELSKVEMFITTQVAYVDVRTSRLVTSSAGHCPLLHCPGSGRPVEVISPEGMPLGVLPDMEFGEATLELRPGCRILMYTDGVTETAAPGGEFFGQARLSTWLSQETAAGHAPATMQQQLIATLASHHGSPVLVDDQTFVILGR